MCFFVNLTNERMAIVDRVRHKHRLPSRQAAFRHLLVEYGRHHDITVPPGPVAKPERASEHNERTSKRAKGRIGVLIPRNQYSWANELCELHGGRSLNETLQMVIDDSERVLSQ